MTANSQSAFRSHRVSTAADTDQGPGRWRIGLIVLANDYALERDFMNLRPSDDVAIFVTRIANTSECTVKTLQAMAPRITAAAQLLVPQGRLDCIAYGCTSGTVAIGYQAICDHIHVARPAITCITPITASLAALDQFRAQRLAVLTPYTDNVNDMIASHLLHNGKTIAGFSSFGIEDNEQMAALSGESIFRAGLEADRPDADALFISCTAIRAVDIADRLEQRLGKPVVTANQALFWQALRASGCGSRVQGCGDLLRHH